MVSLQQLRSFVAWRIDDGRFEIRPLDAPPFHSEFVLIELKAEAARAAGLPQPHCRQGYAQA